MPALGLLVPVVVFTFVSSGHPPSSDRSAISAVPSTGSVELTVEEIAWIRAHPVVRLGFYGGAEPMLIQDVNGGLAGVFPEIFGELSSLTGLEFSIAVHQWHEVQRMVEQKDLDGFLACTPRLAEEQQLSMTIPFSRIVPTVFARMDAPFEVEQISDLIGKRVALVKGVRLHESAVEKIRDQITIVETAGALENLKTVLEGKTDVAIGYAFDDYITVKNNISSVVPVFVDSEHAANVVCATRGDWPELAGILDKGLMAMGEGRLNEIFGRWVHIPRIALRPDFTGGEKAWLKEHQVVRLGFNPDMEPLLMVEEDGSLTGFYPEVFDELSAVLGLDVDIEVDEWSSTVQRVRDGELDGLLTCSPSQAEASNLLRTKPIHRVYPAFLVRQDAQFEMNRLEDLSGKRVAYQNGVTMLEVVLDEFCEQSNHVAVGSALEAIGLLLEGDVDVVCMGNEEAYLLGKYSIAGVRIAYVSLQDENPISSCIRSDWPELVSILNKGMSQIGVTRIEELLARWVSIPAPMQLTPDERVWLSEHKEMRMGIDCAWPPFEFVDRNGEFCGVVADVVGMLNESLGVVMEPQPGLIWEQILDRAKQGELDIVPAIVRDPERESYLRFTDPFLNLPLVVVTRSDHRAIQGLGDLAGVPIALVRGTVAQKYLERDYPGHRLVLCEDSQDVLTSVSQGRAKAGVEVLASVVYAQKQMGLADLHVAAVTDYRYELCFGVRRDWPRMVSILNKELSKIREREKSLMLDKWANVRVHRETDWASVLSWAAAITIVAGVAIFLLWRANCRLLYEIGQRKRAEAELQKSKDELEIRVQQRTMDLEAAVEALRVSQSNLSKAQEVARIGSWHLDLTKNELTWTDETYRIFGIPIGTPLDYEDFLSCIHEDDLDYVRRRWSAALRGEAYDVEHRITVDGQTKWIRDKAELEFNEHGIPVWGIGIAQDITERKQAEQDKAVLQEQLNQAQKMEAVGQLAGGVAHDFNNLLVVIFANIQRIASKVKADLLPEGSLEMLNEAAEQAANVTKSLLTFSRKVSADKQRVDLCEIAQKTWKMLTRMLPSSIELSREISEESVWIQADATQLLQVIMNLSINARDAMPEGGRLSISVSVLSEGDYESVEGGLAGEHVACLTIGDTGTGISPQDRQRIFDPFFTTKPRGQGTGLGLAIVHGIVKDHGGQIDVESSVERGTSFRVLLPLIEPGVAAYPKTCESEPGKGRGELILVAEDRASVRKLVVSTLSSLGYEVLQAEDGEAIMLQMERHKDDIRAMVLDVDLPKRSGLSCLESIRAQGIDTPAIIITATADIGDPERDFSNTVLLQKPFKMSDLGVRVGKMLTTQRLGIRTLG